MIFMLFICSLEIYDIYSQVNAIDDKLAVLPMQLRDKYRRFVKALIGGEVFVLFAALGALFYCMRAWSSNTAYYRHSVSMSTKGWVTHFFAPFVLFIACPFALSFRSDLLERDLCTYSLVALMQLGPEFRSAYAYGSRSEPELASLAYHPVPAVGDDIEKLKNWPGYIWCDKYKAEWEEKVFSTRWKRLSKVGVGRPTMAQVRGSMNIEQKHEGIVTSTLLKMAMNIGTQVDKSFMACSSDFGSAKPGSSLLEDARGRVFQAANSSSLSPLVGAPSHRRHDGGAATTPAKLAAGDHLQHAHRNGGAPKRIMRGEITQRHHGPLVQAKNGFGATSSNSSAQFEHKSLAITSSGELEEISMEAGANEESSSLSLRAVNAHGELLKPLLSRSGSASHSLAPIRSHGSGRDHSAVRSSGVNVLAGNHSSLLATDMGNRDSIPDEVRQAQEYSLQGVCMAYVSSLGVMRSSRAGRQAMKSILGAYTTAQAVKTLFPKTLAIVGGIGKAVANVKAVLPHASAPGYILIVSVMAYLPSLMLLLSIVSQLVGQIFLSFALLLFAFAFSFEGYKGYKMTLADSEKSMKKGFKEAETQSKKAKTFAAVFLLCWAGYLYRQFCIGGPDVEAIRELAESFQLQNISVGLPLMIAQMILSFLYARMITSVVFTDLLMISVFDAADDELEAKKSGSIDEDKEELIKGWQKIYPKDKKKKKKDKKNKKEKKEEKDGKLDGEGEYAKGKGKGESPDDAWYSQGAQGGYAGWDGPSAAQYGHSPGW